MVGPATKLAKLEPMAERMSEQEQDWETGWGCAIQEIDQSLSFVPVEPSEEPDPGSPRHLIPNRRIAVSDIIPLTLSSGQVCQPFSSSILHPQPWQVSLGVDPTCSSLPISPIFIKTGGGPDGAEEGGEEGSLVTYGLLDSLELPNIPTELLSLGKHQHAPSYYQHCTNCSYEHMIMSVNFQSTMHEHWTQRRTHLKNPQQCR